MALTSNYSSGTDYNQNMPVDPGYLGTPIYQQTSGALSSTQPSSTVPVSSPTAASPANPTAAAGMATGASGAALPPQINAPVTDYTQLPQYLKDFDVGNRAQSGWLGAGPNPQYAANGVNDFNKLSGMYGNDAAMNPYYLTDAFKNDPRFSRTSVANPFATYDWNYAGFGSPTNGGPTAGYSFYAPGQGFNPINGQWAQGGQTYAPPQAANGHDTYWSQQNLSNLSPQVNQYLPGSSVNSLYGQRGTFAHDNYYPTQAAQQMYAQQNPGGY